MSNEVPTDGQVRARADELEKHLSDPYGNSMDLMALSFLIARIVARRASTSCETTDSTLRKIVTMSFMNDGLDLVSALMLEEALVQLEKRSAN